MNVNHLDGFIWTTVSLGVFKICEGNSEYVDCVVAVLLKRLPRLSVAILGVLAVICFQTTPAQSYDSEELTTIRVYEKAAPAVVSVEVMTSDGPSTGTGFLVSPQGHLITSLHVIGESQYVKVTLASGEIFQARVIAKSSSGSDVAVLQLNASQTFPYLNMVSYRDIRVGQKVFAIGNPYGFDRTLTLGIVSRLDQKNRRIQTDASINPGSSGGPLLNSDGEVIGVSQSIYNPDGDRSNIGIGFASPMDDLRKYIASVQLTPKGQVSHTASQEALPGEHPVQSSSAQGSGMIPTQF